MQSFAPLLGSILVRTNADGVYLYRFDNQAAEARLLVWAGRTPAGHDTASITSGHAHRESPIVLHREAWHDQRFVDFPEFAANRFEGVASVPLIDRGATLGILNICRVRPASLDPRELTYLLGLSLPLGALLAGSDENQSLRGEVERLTRQLADRKLIDRAKGILQARFAWTEEQAYLYLRRSSRSRRTPLRDIALGVIENRERFPLEVERRAS
jgi:GAF domain-containing protein